MKRIRALASKRLDGRTIHVIEGDVNQGDEVLIETEANTVRATVTKKGAFNFAVSKEGGDEGRGAGRYIQNHSHFRHSHW